MSRICWTFFGLCLGVAACASPSPKPATTEGNAKATAPVVPPPTGVVASPVVPPPAVTPPPAITPSEPVAKQGRDHRSVVACTTDADCGWDDPCMPKRCVEPSPAVGCDKSLPPPGTCSCLEGACTLEPAKPPEPSGTCEVRGCMVDRAAGTCVADTGGVPENIRATSPVNVGPSCDCPNPTKGCAFSWFDAVPCTTDRDCWIDPSPRKHPIARPKALRKRDFKPCKDGETAPKCGPAGQCIIGPGYSC